MKYFLMCSAAVLTLSACSDNSTSPQATSQSDQTMDKPNQSTTKIAESASAELGNWGIELADINPEIYPGNDFFRHVNGQWLNTFEIPEEFSNYGAFTVLFERAEKRVRKIIEDAAAAEAPAGSVEAKIGAYYASYLDIDAINTKGLEPAKAGLDKIAAATSHDDIARLFGTVDLPAEAPFGAYVNVDSKNPDQYITYLYQAGLGMPDRDYYLEESFAEKRDSYSEFLTKFISLAGKENAEKRAAAVLKLEDALAKVHWSRAKQRNRDLTYNLYTSDELKAYAPEFPWSLMLAESGLGAENKFVVQENDAIQASAKIFAQTSVNVWKDYLTVHYLSANASVLPIDFDQINFEFYSTALRGVEKQRERWKRGVGAVNGTLGEAVGQVYVNKYFPESSKEKMQELVGNLKKAFAIRIDNLEWMSDETKEEARAKLAAFNTKIGYPDEWKDYSKLDVLAGDAFGNNIRSSVWQWNEMIAKLGQPIDRNEWLMTPQTINAYYNPQVNEIVFPAAILQAPFFDPEADDAVNYGGIGAVIGHEISHGFDDQGRKSDGTGLLRDWWTKEDAARFDERAQKLGAQYAKYSPLEGEFVNPKLTMGENIGDLGGLTVAYEAYKLSQKGQEAPMLDGYSGDQRFFMAWAQVWKRKYRPDELKSRLTGDSHSPSEYRTNGIVRNMDEWYAAFNIPEGDELYLAPEDRVKIW